MTSITYLAQPFLKIGGQQASETLMADILEISVEESLRQPGQFTLIIDNNTFPGSGEPWRHEAEFSIGDSIEIGFSSATNQAQEFSQGQSNENIFQGEITSIEGNFSETSQATLIIRGYDIGHRLYRGRYNRSFQNMSDTDIVKKIIGEIGIPKGTLDPSGAPHDYIFQENQNNMDFLRERALRNGFELFVQDGKLNFRKPKPGNRLDLKWLRDIHRFNVRVSSAEQINSVEVRGWDYQRKQAVVAQANSANLITKTDYREGKQTSSAFNGQPQSPVMVVVDKPVFSNQEADAIAQSLCDEIGGEFVQADAVAEGNPDIRAGKLVQLADLGKYSGQYYISEARHIYDKGVYRSEFSVRGLRAEEFSTNTSPKPSLEPGQTVLVGVVSNNRDPEGLGRVRVKFPTLTEDHESNWARIVAMGAGSARGWDCLPEINDEVLVAFEHGDIHRPYVMGAVWNGKDKPPESVQDSVGDGKVRLRTFQTRIGHKLQFVEEDKNSRKQGIYLDTATSPGHQFHLNDSDKTIHLKSNGNHSFLLNDKAKQIELTSSGQHTLLFDDSGKKKIDVTSSGDINVATASLRTLTAKAGTVEVTGTQKITLKVGASLLELSNSGIKITAPDVQVAGLQGVNVQSPAKIDLQSLGLLNLNAAGVLSGKAGGAINLQAGAATSIVSGAAFQVTAGAAATITSAAVFQATGGITAALVAPIVQLKGVPILG